MSTSWNGQIYNNKRKYSIQFETNNYDTYKRVEKLCQEIIDEENDKKSRKFYDFCSICKKEFLKEDLSICNGKWTCPDCNKLQNQEDYKDNLSPKEFVETYCNNCRLQGCEGIGTVWFQDCKYRNRLKQFGF